MAAKSESMAPGQHLRCGHCGTEVELHQVGGGRMECCDEPMEACAGGHAPRSAGHARCSGCGNEVDILRDGGGDLECCNEGMERA